MKVKIIGAFSRSEIENIIEPRKSRKSVLISITSKNEKFPKPKGDYDKILQVKFDDEEIEYHGLKLITNKQAEEIINFALNNIDKDIFVNCDAGLSRSPAIVVALEEIFNGNDVKDKYPLHNKYVYRKIKDVWLKHCWGAE